MAADTSFLTSAVDRDEWSVSRAGRVTFGERTPQAFIKYAGSAPEIRGCSEKFTNDTLYRLYATCVRLLTAAEPRGVHGLQWTLLVPATVCLGQQLSARL
jgi:hypothetical protein